ncbi:hypothetical protein Pcinc_005915 [Petrolisthes cinctipes]|uniref:Uncharacterized protein n=1 Tax=Petrolisthes cinctipes TaxID=88211 RepID=A0AAE1KZM4_PETCI|nr:hypothetical protein Pcinc_005915 [Petrolisthes cinctipes]
MGPTSTAISTTATAPTFTAATVAGTATLHASGALHSSPQATGRTRETSRAVATWCPPRYCLHLTPRQLNATHHATLHVATHYTAKPLLTSQPFTREALAARQPHHPPTTPCVPNHTNARTLLWVEDFGSGEQFLGLRFRTRDKSDPSDPSGVTLPSANDRDSPLPAAATSPLHLLQTPLHSPVACISQARPTASQQQLLPITWCSPYSYYVPLCLLTKPQSRVYH